VPGPSRGSPEDAHNRRSRACRLDWHTARQVPHPSGRAASRSGSDPHGIDEPDDLRLPISVTLEEGRVRGRQPDHWTGNDSAWGVPTMTPQDHPKGLEPAARNVLYPRPSTMVTCRRCQADGFQTVGFGGIFGRFRIQKDPQPAQIPQLVSSDQCVRLPAARQPLRSPQPWPAPKGVPFASGIHGSRLGGSARPGRGSRR
jgi:hypothetical protein